MSGTNFRGGRKPFPKLSAFESEIHPTHKPSVYASGISPLQGADSRRREFTVRKNRTVFIHAATKGRRMDAVSASSYIFEQMCSNIDRTSQKSPCSCQKAVAVNRPYGHGIAESRPITAAHRKNGGGKLPGREKGYL